MGDAGISLSELGDYLKDVDSASLPQPVANFPVPVDNDLGIPDPLELELNKRPEHVPDHLPLMGLDLTEEEGEENAAADATTTTTTITTSGVESISKGDPSSSALDDGGIECAAVGENSDAAPGASSASTVDDAGMRGEKRALSPSASSVEDIGAPMTKRKRGEWGLEGATREGQSGEITYYDR